MLKSACRQLVPQCRHQMARAGSHPAPGPSPAAVASDAWLAQARLDLLAVYRAAVASVLPDRLVTEAIRRVDDSRFELGGREFALHRNVTVVGFGKAVLRMGHAACRALAPHVRRGILSVPVGAAAGPEAEELAATGVEVREGARDNLPDAAAAASAAAIARLASSLGKDDLLLVLISGGGSALLPAPAPPLTVGHKAELTQKLQSRGANIQELNCVRKKLSVLKGGGLLRLARPAPLVALILSDVIGDPLESISSGPTVPNPDGPDDALAVVRKYGLEAELEPQVLEALHARAGPVDPCYVSQSVHNALVGSNRIALEAARAAAAALGFVPVVLSDRVAASVDLLAEVYSDLCGAFCSAAASRSPDGLKDVLARAIHALGISEDSVSSIVEAAMAFGKGSDPNLKTRPAKGVCLILGGEPTVTVDTRKPGARGGRSQELSLRFSVQMAQKSADTSQRCILLAAGTDGMDGPTPAAGAFGHAAAVSVLNAAQDALGHSDSYGYYSQLRPSDLVVTGHSGTNVMDVHLLLISANLSCG